MIEAPMLALADKQPATYALDLCARIAACTDTPGSITRLFLSPATHEVHAILRIEMEALGMSVRVDSAGNLRGLYAGADNKARVLLSGSHVDTVPNAGAFDGVLGVAIPLAVLRSLNGRKLQYAVEVIAFSEEEGIRFKMPFIGSRAVIGNLGTKESERLDASGISVQDALDTFGVDAHASPALTHGTFAFLECHIEQGPVLEALDLPLGIVTAIVGQTRLEVTFTGMANHAGTTPMHLRHDALAAAAAWISVVERHAPKVTGLVATVGSIRVTPGAANVIPGEAVLSLDVRHASDTLRDQAVAELTSAAHVEGASRGVTVGAKETSRQQAVVMDERLCTILADSVASRGATPHRMTSGAGHDAMILAGHLPLAMLFLRTPGGVSHHPNEAVALADVQAAIDVLADVMMRLETEP